MINVLLYFSDACSIEIDTDRVVITGGRVSDFSNKTVSVYGIAGWITDLPPMNVARANHGCSSYLSEDANRVIMQSVVYCLQT